MKRLKRIRAIVMMRYYRYYLAYQNRRLRKDEIRYVEDYGEMP